MRKDWRGTPITLGCTIIYSTHVGRRSEVTEGIVAWIYEKELVVTPTRNTKGPLIDARAVRLRALDRVTVLPVTDTEPSSARRSGRAST